VQKEISKRFKPVFSAPVLFKCSQCSLGSQPVVVYALLAKGADVGTKKDVAVFN
jgi:hypothetical protein